MLDYSSDCFLVGAFFLKEKSPTITVGSFFSADNLTLNGPLFLQFLNFLQFLAYEVVYLYHLRNSTGPKSIFGSVRLFFEIFFSPKGPTFNFLIFLDRMDFEKSQMVPPFSFFGIVRLFSRKNSIKGSPIHQYFDTLKSFCYF